MQTTGIRLVSVSPAGLSTHVAICTI